MHHPFLKSLVSWCSCRCIHLAGKTTLPSSSLFFPSSSPLPLPSSLSSFSLYSFPPWDQIQILLSWNHHRLIGTGTRISWLAFDVSMGSVCARGQSLIFRCVISCSLKHISRCPCSPPNILTLQTQTSTGRHICLWSFKAEADLIGDAACGRHKGRLPQETGVLGAARGSQPKKRPYDCRRRRSTLEEAGAAADGRLGFGIAPVSVSLWVIGS